MTDAGLFSPASVTWRVHADPLVGLAGLRALLLRALHPVADDATAQRDYLTRARLRDDPWGRLRDLADAVTITTFGSAAEALTVAARARAVSGTLTGSRSVGGRWQGDDEDLLLWEHVCRVDSFLTVVRRGGLRLTDQEADDYVAEQVRAGVGRRPLDRGGAHRAPGPHARRAGGRSGEPPPGPGGGVPRRGPHRAAGLGGGVRTGVRGAARLGAADVRPGGAARRRGPGRDRGGHGAADGAHDADRSPVVAGRA
jgi:hypothetical protein